MSQYRPLQDLANAFLTTFWALTSIVLLTLVSVERCDAATV